LEGKEKSENDNEKKLKNLMPKTVFSEEEIEQ